MSEKLSANQHLQEKYHDLCEFVNNIKKLGGNEQMAEYTARYNENYVNKTVKEYIADLHLERFATKDDINRLDHKIDLVEQRLDAKINGVEHRLDAKINAVEQKLHKHTMFLLFTIIITTLVPDSVKHSIWTLLHL